MCECTSALCNCKCPSFLVGVTVFSHSDKIFEWDVTMLHPFGKKLVSCAHGNMHSFSVFSREAVWPSSSGNLQLSFLRALMHCKLQISFSYQGTTFFFFFPSPGHILPFSSCFEKSRIMHILQLCLVIFLMTVPPSLPSHLHLKECHLHKLVARRQLSWETQCVK